MFWNCNNRKNQNIRVGWEIVITSRSWDGMMKNVRNVGSPKEDCEVSDVRLLTKILTPLLNIGMRFSKNRQIPPNLHSHCNRRLPWTRSNVSTENVLNNHDLAACLLFSHQVLDVPLKILLSMRFWYRETRSTQAWIRTWWKEIAWWVSEAGAGASLMNSSGARTSRYLFRFPPASQTTRIAYYSKPHLNSCCTWYCTWVFECWIAFRTIEYLGLTIAALPYRRSVLVAVMMEFILALWCSGDVLSSSGHFGAVADIALGSPSQILNRFKAWSKGGLLLTRQEDPLNEVWNFINDT